MNEEQVLHNAVERAREWAVPMDDEKRKRPTLTETSEWVNRQIALSREAAEEAKESRG